MKETFENVMKMTSEMRQIAGNRGQFLTIYLRVDPQTPMEGLPLPYLLIF